MSSSKSPSNTILISIERDGAKVFSNGREMPVTPSQRDELLWVLNDIAKCDGSLRALRLTAREEQILRLIKGGASNKQIARVLNLSPGTVKVFVNRLLGKAGLSSRLQLAISLPVA